MPRPMRRFKINEPMVERHLFVVNLRNFGHKEYHEYGKKKVFSNKKQADNRVAELCLNGFECYRSMDHPYVIILKEF